MNKTIKAKVTVVARVSVRVGVAAEQTSANVSAFGADVAQ